MRVEVIVLIVYFGLMIGMGLWYNKKTKSAEDMMVGGRSMGPIVTALTLQTTAMSGYMFMGGPAMAYEVGYFAVFYAVGDSMGGLINITVLERRMRRFSQLIDAISPIEYLEKRYESIPVKVIACVISVFGLSCYVLAQFLSTGKTIVALFQIDMKIGLICGVTVILFYTFVGGYFAVAIIDVIQGIIMISAIIAIFLLSLSHYGGLTGLNESIGAIDPTLLGVWGKGNMYEGQWGVLAGAILIYMVGYMGLPHSVNKHMACASPQIAKESALYATIWTQLFCFIPYFIGLAGLVTFGPLWGADGALDPALQAEAFNKGLMQGSQPEGLGDVEMVIPSLAQMMFPGLISGIVLTAIMSAIMSTVAALMLLIATIVAIDLYQRWINPSATDKQVVFLSRATIVIVGIIGMIVALYAPPAIFSLVVDCFSFMACAFLPSFIGAIYWKWGNSTGSVASMIVGAGVVELWSQTSLESTTGLHQMLAGLICSVIAYVVGSKFGKPTSPEMCELMDRAKGTKIEVSSSVQAAQSKHLAVETKAITQFVFNKKAMAAC